MLRVLPSDPDLLDYRYSVFQSSEMAVVSPFATSTSGTTGAQVVFTSVLATLGAFENRYGIATLETGTNSTGRAVIQTPLLDQIVPGFGRLSFCAIIRTPSNLSDATNRYGIKIGLGALTSSINDTIGVHLRYRDNLNSGKWQAYTVDYLGTVTSTDTGITVAVSTWYRLEAFVNKDATSTDYYINGSKVATVAATIQSGTSMQMGLIAMIAKSAGTTSRSMLCDYLDFRQEVTR
jgi:hypothetical protein